MTEILTAKEATALTAIAYPEVEKKQREYENSVFIRTMDEIKKAAIMGENSISLYGVYGVSENFYNRFIDLGYKFGKTTITHGGMITENERGCILWDLPHIEPKAHGSVASKDDKRDEP